jgi:hypothetical protein
MEATSSIKNFSDFGITTNIDFEGNRIFALEILGEPIVVHHYEIRPSKKKEKAGTDYLYAQITYKGEKRLLMSESIYLMKALNNVPEEGFPFQAKIVRTYRSFSFRGI